MIGPYEVISVKENGNVVIKTSPTVMQTVHSNRLRLAEVDRLNELSLRDQYNIKINKEREKQRLKIINKEKQENDKLIRKQLKFQRKLDKQNKIITNREIKKKLREQKIKDKLERIRKKRDKKKLRHEPISHHYNLRRNQ